MNFNRMTIINGSVFKVKAHWSDSNLGGGNKLSFFVPHYAKPLFSGTPSECEQFISQCCAEYV
jgi:hypothetical protein